VGSLGEAPAAPRRRLSVVEPPPVLLLGCVKRKRPGIHPARDLYCSPLWQARCAYAERSGSRWFILSALARPVQPLVVSRDSGVADDGVFVAHSDNIAEPVGSNMAVPPELPAETGSGATARVSGSGEPWRF
jgi:Family of unknown function (DUF6884)